MPTARPSLHRSSISIIEGRDKANYAVVVLRRDFQMANQVDAIAAKVDRVFAAYAAIEKITAARIAAVEKRVAAAAAVLPALDRIEKVASGRPEAPGLADMRQTAALRRRAAERGGPCRDGGTRQCAAHPLRRGGETLDERVAARRRKCRNSAPAVAALAAIGRSADNLFLLRERELQAIALELQAMKPVRRGSHDPRHANSASSSSRGGASSTTRCAARRHRPKGPASSSSSSLPAACCPCWPSPSSMSAATLPDGCAGFPARCRRWPPATRGSRCRTRTSATRSVKCPRRSSSSSARPSAPSSSPAR